MDGRIEPKLVPHVLYEPDETGILWVTLNRPDRMNATAPDTVEKVAEYMQAGDSDPNIRVIVLTGAGRGFCAGNDMKATNRQDRSQEGVDGHRQHFAHYFQPQFKKISEIRKPTIAMVNGPAAGSGLDMSLHCDMRVGSENARFFTYQNAGQIIENGGFYFLPRIIGLGRALEFLYTGGWIYAEDAYKWGLLNHLAPAERLEEVTRELCDRIIKSPPLIQWIGKRIMRRALDSSLDTTLDMCANASIILGTAEDRHEARRSFLEKRSPVYQGL
jgi:enoyl-CoA hydratase/carnithine racemase